MRKRKKEKDDPFFFVEKGDLSQSMSMALERSFNLRNLSIRFIDVLIAYLISLIIEQPLTSLSHFIRTGKWVIQTNILSFLLFLLFIGGIVLILYIIGRPIRDSIEDRIKLGRGFIISEIISFVFAILFIDIIIEPLQGVSSWIVSGFTRFEYDLGYLIDRIITSLILLLGFVIYYYILRCFEEKEIRLDS